MAQGSKSWLGEVSALVESRSCFSDSKEGFSWMVGVAEGCAAPLSGESSKEFPIVIACARVEDM